MVHVPRVIVKKCYKLINVCYALGVDPRMPMSEVFKKFDLDNNTQEFTGHAVALYRDDE